MSAIGTKQTPISTLNMSAFGAKRTSLIGWPVSANDPKRHCVGYFNVQPNERQTSSRLAVVRESRSRTGPINAICLRQARLHEIESVADEDCRVSEGISQPPRLQSDS